MKTVTEHIRHSVLKNAAINPLDYDQLIITEWSSQFEQLQRNRLIIGALRYGCFNDPKKKRYNRCDSIHKRLKIYEKTRNTEYLVDIANMAMLEFEEGNHKKKHFRSVKHEEHTSKPNAC